MQPLAPNFQANVEVIALTGNPAVKFLRCRPAPHNGKPASGSSYTLAAA